jgi:formamidopyrimidine-DNA glycosylase
MPELPEVETTLRAIEKFKNQRLYNIKVHNRNLRWKVDKDLEINSKNQIIKNLRRRAKYIIFDLDKCSIILHLGMSGSLRIANNDNNYFLKHDHVEFLFENEKIIYNDPRRFGSIHLTDDIDKHRLIDHLGPEPLSKDFNSKYLLALCSKSKTNIKTLLMNQKNVVGIGNIYASETLYLAKVNPLKDSSKLTIDDCKKVVSSSKKVLNAAIKVGGTTLKDFYSADGNPGYFKFKLNVYGREGLDCKRCKTKIAKTNINKRATYYCSSCQS